MRVMHMSSHVPAREPMQLSPHELPRTLTRISPSVKTCALMEVSPDTLTHVSSLILRPTVQLEKLGLAREGRRYVFVAQLIPRRWPGDRPKSCEVKLPISVCLQGVLRGLCANIPPSSW